MANVVFQSHHDTIFISFNDLSAAADTEKSKWRKDALVCVFLKPNGATVVRTLYKQDFTFTFNGGVAGSLPVDSVDGVQPTDNAHLYALISGIVD